MASDNASQADARYDAARARAAAFMAELKADDETTDEEQEATTPKRGNHQ